MAGTGTACGSGEHGRTKMNVEIVVCVGSSCHYKGSGAVIDTFRSMIREYKLQDQVTMKASFCQKACTSGIAVSFNGQVIHHLTPELAEAAFRSHVLGWANHD